MSVLHSLGSASFNHERLSREQLTRICAVAGILLAGPSESPAPAALPEFPDLVQKAANTLGRDSSALEEAIARLPEELSGDTLTAYAGAEAGGFELLALVVVGAYFMSQEVLAALGLPTGDRRRAPLELAVDQLGTGILDAVLERGSPVKTLQDIADRTAG